MADDLGEEWWLEGNTENEETNCREEKETGGNDSSCLKGSQNNKCLEIESKFSTVKHSSIGWVAHRHHA